MPKLNTLKYEHENLSFRYDVYIDKQGHFTTTIPKDVVEKLRGIGVELQKGRRENYGYFSATSLQALEDKVREVADRYSEKKLTGERIVIRYAVETVCSYCKGASGKLYPNGGWEMHAEGHENGYHWASGTKGDSFGTGSYSFEVAFEIRKVKTWLFPSGEQSKEYLRLEDSEIKDDEVLHWLNSLCRLSLSQSSNVKEIEYTREIGMLFKNMVLFIFKINENIRAVFGEEFDLGKIDPKKIPLLGEKLKKN